MDWKTFWITLLTSGGLTGVANLIFTEWYKRRLDHQFNEKLATHTAKLERENELAISEFKHKLETAALERNVQYSQVFKTTVEVIETTYKNLLAMKDAVD